MNPGQSSISSKQSEVKQFKRSVSVKRRAQPPVAAAFYGNERLYLLLGSSSRREALLKGPAKRCDTQQRSSATGSKHGRL